MKDVVLELHIQYRGNERRIIREMMGIIGKQKEEYPKLKNWLNRRNVVQYVKTYIYQLKQAKKL